MRVLTHAYTEEDLLNGLQAGTGEVIRYIYRKNLSPVKQLVTRFPGIILETEDVLQEGLTRLILNIRKGKFSGKSSLNTYLYSICRNICLKENQRSQQANRFRDEEKATEEFGNPFGDADETEKDYEMIQRVIKAKEKMESQCVEIIDARFAIRSSPFALRDKQSTDCRQRTANSEQHSRLTPFEEVAEHLGISADNARQRFKRCLERLIRMVRPEAFQVN
ncbi:MAG: sigma-70 family RNA polymerase sigma factor [Bacteroidetes bacterium]|nr:MAG: sigma-70 family RNA polymerase sigma factor [Bacteroidota bacterium]